MLVGTLVGLVIKYILDKNYIFYIKTKTQEENLKKFVLYTFTGLSTTAIFWGTEIAFNIFWNKEYAKFIGAFVGLSIGYIIKYNLDKKYVFSDEELN